jgi:hypothetical protein
MFEDWDDPSFLGLLLSNKITFRLARPKTRAAFRPAGPPPIMAQSNNMLIYEYSYLLNLA